MNKHPAIRATLGSLKLANGTRFDKATKRQFKKAIAKLHPNLVEAHEVLLEFALLIPDPDARAMAAHAQLQEDYEALSAHMHAMRLWLEWSWE